MWNPFTGMEGQVIYLEGSLWQYVGRVEGVEHDATGICWVELSGTWQLFGESKDGPDEGEQRRIGRVRIPHTQVCALQLAKERWPDWEKPENE